jgi:demethylmenaquinone methyltransferase/2-methoxy-6-polyprenyl-1,4-benzoquinol methylase
MDPVLASQVRYYRDRAPEYEDWWFRRGRYDGGEEFNARWFADVAAVEAALVDFDPAGDVLELACGTGLWTRHLIGVAGTLTAVDASSEVIELNRARVGGDAVQYIQADLFTWQPPAQAFDVCFFSYWLSHVPVERFDAYWETVRAALRPRGRVFFIDSAAREPSRRGLPEDEVETRMLSNGNSYRVVKHYYQPEKLEHRLAGLGWRCEVALSPRGYILYGHGSPA